MGLDMFVSICRRRIVSKMEEVAILYCIWLVRINFLEYLSKASHYFIEAREIARVGEGEV